MKIKKGSRRRQYGKKYLLNNSYSLPNQEYLKEFEKQQRKYSYYLLDYLYLKDLYAEGTRITQYQIYQ